MILSTPRVVKIVTVMYCILDQPSLQWDCGLVSPVKV